MLQDRYEKDKFFEHIFNLAAEMDPILAQIDRLLDDEVLYQLIRRDFAKRHPHTETTGRKSTPVEVILRMLVVRRLYNWSFEQTEKRVKDSLVLRWFCRVYFESVPDDTTLIRWAGQVQAETLTQFNQRLTGLATQLKVTRGRKLRTDGTVVETNIQAPTDSQLLADSVRVLGRTLRRARKLLVEKGALGPEVFRNRSRSAKKTARRAASLMGRNQDLGQQAYAKLVQITQKTIAQVKKVVPVLKDSAEKQVERLVETCETFLPRAEQVISQTMRRVFQDESVPAAEKIVSLFEPHSDILRRGKVGKPVEYGHKVWLDEVEGGLVSNWRVLAGNPNDKTQLTPSLEAHEAQFEKPPEQVSADRGVYSAPNEQENIARNKTLINGARYYVDHAHPEYSCPEVTNPRELVIHEKAGERILEASRRESNGLLPAGTQMLLYKNNSDRKGNSYGAHENYLMDRRTSFKQVVEHLMPFFVTRAVYCGAGKVGSENRNQPCEYQITQRADFFETEVALDTMVKRPIINTRDEPHADREKYRRLHVIVGDANLSEYTIYLRSGTAAIVLSMIEDGAIGKSLALRDPVRAIKEVSHDPTCTRKIQMENGKAFTAVEIQREYLELAQQYLSQRSSEPWEQDILDKWAEVLEALERDPMELDTRIDWVMKKALIEGFMERKGLDWEAAQVQMLDLQYHDLRPDKGLYYMLERQGRAERVATDEEIVAAITKPPEDTRAYFRGECLRRYGSAVFGVNWDSISFSVDDEPINRILMAEPLKGSKAHVAELLEASPTAADLVKNLRA